MLTTFAAIVAYMGYLVNDNPSLNCLNAWKIISGIKEIATKFRYGMAKSTTSGGWFIAYINGFAIKTIKKSAMPKTVQRNRPCLNDDFPAAKLFSPSASATKGVMAVENPIPKLMAINIKLLPNETAASSAVPN